VIALTRDRPLLAVLAVLAGLGALAMTVGAQGATSAASRPCSLSLHDQLPPGGTPAYDLTVSVRNTSCATGTEVMKAFHRCRTGSGARCTKRVLRTWACTGRRTSAPPTFLGTFTCRSGSGRVASSYRQDTPDCFGAAARDPELPCFNPSRTIYPAPGDSDTDASHVCGRDVVKDACVFGASAKSARGHFALLGDSHTFHWQAALSVLAAANQWRGYSISAGGCFFSAVVASFSEGCVPWYLTALHWFDDHPEVSTVFVTSNADTPVAVPDGQTSDEVKIDGFRRAWQALPKTVKHIVVLRDLTVSTDATFSCVYTTVAAGTQRPGPACALARSVALRKDLGVETVRVLRSSRYQQIDLSDFLCGRTACAPVVGGALVNGDIFGHLNPTFMRTLGPYLLRAVRRLQAGW
jgi:hypothetical protein